MAQSVKTQYLNQLKKIIQNMGKEQVLHAKRVKLFARLIVDAILREKLIPDLNELRSTLELIPDAAYFHDLGKSEISPDYYFASDILTDPGQELYRSHVLEGFKIFDGIVDLFELPPQQMDEFSTIMSCILEHHERFDGGGFPNGLAGEEISYAGRITAVADSLDNYLIGSKNKDKISFEFAIDRLQTHSGTRFDPDIISALVFAREDIEDKLYLLENGSLSEIQDMDDDKNKPMELMIRPIFNAYTRQVNSYKATLRLYDKEFGTMYNRVYGPIAEKYDLIKEIEEHQMYETAKAYNNFIRRGVAFDKIFVDLSTKYLEKKYAADNILRIFEKQAVNPAKISFVVIESLLANTRVKVIENLAILRQRGFGIALYDFGSESTSFTKISDLNLTDIILARDFASQVVYDTTTKEVVRSIVALAKKLRLGVVANGIENRIEEQVMKELGVRYMEGAFYGDYKKEKYIRNTNQALAKGGLR